jgi:hypothetical protein
MTDRQLAELAATLADSATLVITAVAGRRNKGDILEWR